MGCHQIAVALTLTTSVALASACGGGSTDSAAADAPDERCGSLTDLDLIDLRITSAVSVPAGEEDPGHCAVGGVIETEINFELLLPDEWNGRFVMGGGGGFVGIVQNQAQTDYATGGRPLTRGYATAGTDTGHVREGIEADWALNNLERQVNFGHRAVHLTTEAAKSILRYYYGEAEQYSYFVGCSRGGGQGMMESQRYPNDFDGIVSGAPAYDWTGIAAQFVQTQQAIYPDGDLSTPIITPDNLRLLAESIDTACDTLDGVEDDILGDPRVCGFRPDDLPRCSSADAAAGCVTETQLAAINAVYDGPRRQGQPIHFGFPYGGENDAGGWDTWVVESDAAREGGVPNRQYGFGTNLFKYFIFSDPEWDYTTYDFSTWAEDSAATAAILNATDADLGPFRDAGGKIIYWTGWSDLALSAFGTIDYVERVHATDPSFSDYTRLYLLPGVLHCRGGPGPSEVNWLDAIRRWVEDDVRPDRLVAQKLDQNGSVSMSRPACPYPQVPTYRGDGDPSSEASFACVDPQ